MQDIKIHKKLAIPKDSAWDRKTIKKHLPKWVNYITICLNLIERIQADYYELEHMSYRESKIITSDTSNKDYKKIDIVTTKEWYSEYINKNKLTYKKALVYLEENKTRYSIPITNLDLICSTMSMLKHKKAEELLFKILNKKINSWWD